VASAKFFGQRTSQKSEGSSARGNPPGRSRGGGMKKQGKIIHKQRDFEERGWGQEQDEKGRGEERGRCLSNSFSRGEGGNSSWRRETSDA